MPLKDAAKEMEKEKAIEAENSGIVGEPESGGDKEEEKKEGSSGGGKRSGKKDPKDSDNNEDKVITNVSLASLKREQMNTTIRVDTHERLRDISKSITDKVDGKYGIGKIIEDLVELYSDEYLKVKLDQIIPHK